ncbi:MAG TPA: helicase-associated domain-containing protein [Micromonosporaceae bacterium]|nr:helicase-associated domain-containing protein [Micromonosporaceae bacterium]
MGTALADHLRSLPDDGLGLLIELRPDLVVPVPADVSALAVRVQSRLSVARALDGLDQFTLEVLDALRLSRTEELTSVDAVLALTSVAAHGPDPATVRAAIDVLRAHVLVYGADAALRIVPTVDEVCSPYPAGLGRPAEQLDEAAAALVADPAKLRRTLLSAPPPARAVLDRLAAGPPVGTVARDLPEDSPVRWLLGHHLLVQVGDGSVELPREVGLLLRRDAGPLGPLHPQPPATEPVQRDPEAADSAGAGQAMEVVRHAEAILEALAAEPPLALRSGGLGIRELRRLAKATGLDESTTAVLVELAWAAGLIGTAELSARSVESQFLPSGSYDHWCGSSIARRWAALARAWLAMTREPRLVGERDERDRPLNALSPEAERAAAPGTRRAVLRVLADQPEGAAPAIEDVLARLAWQAPRRAKGREPGTRAVLAEATLLGLTGLGALTSYGRALLAVTVARADEDDPLGVRARPDDPADPVIAGLDALVPAPVDHVLVQADLTVVVPGPPEPALAAELAVVAEHESAGGATVYRVTPASVRRALDAGYAAADLHALFARRSRTPVPQGLTYLVDDVARRHGGLRVGTAGAYLRSDDEALLAELLVDRRLATLALRRLAPTVLATPSSAARLLAALREAGHAPVAEDATGAAVLTRPKVRRAPARPPVRTTDPLAPVRLPVPRVLGIVEQIRRGDAAARAARRAPVSVRPTNGHPLDGFTAAQAHTQALAVLQQAMRDKVRVWVGYVDAHGAAAQRLVRPVSIGGGYLRAEDERTETLHTFALHRITAAVPDDAG